MVCAEPLVEHDKRAKTGCHETERVYWARADLGTDGVCISIACRLTDEITSPEPKPAALMAGNGIMLLYYHADDRKSMKG